MQSKPDRPQCNAARELPQRGLTRTRGKPSDRAALVSALQIGPSPSRRSCWGQHCRVVRFSRRALQTHRSAFPTHKGLQTENGAVPGDVPAAPTPCSTLQSSAIVPLGICEAMFDLNGVQEQLAVDRARPQVSRTRCTANRGNTASKASAEAKQAQSSLSSAAYKCRRAATANRCSDFNYEATTQPTASSFTFHFRRTNGAGIVPLMVSGQP